MEEVEGGEEDLVAEVAAGVVGEGGWDFLLLEVFVDGFEGKGGGEGVGCGGVDGDAGWDAACDVGDAECFFIPSGGFESDGLGVPGFTEHDDGGGLDEVDGVFEDGGGADGIDGEDAGAEVGDGFSEFDEGE